ncbi:MAG: Antibiotic biosynthesis monooxygenase [Naasia sp.]|jgi:hypothetical protein|uniref:hypothetical protein n=1 Tax=Naasia sp. TaxID=2546198 RepID=UPI0026019ADE|nr:hypothetical protein [Naasia sp.]MCU1570591.1 Antibiotic biosynthesis monooxygenase [Naasia sp.]
MTTLQIEHPISDFGTWSAAFARFAPARKQGGVLASRILRPEDDPAYVVIELDFADVEHAASFERFLRQKVWASPSTSPALAGEPKTRILSLVGGSTA